YEIAEKTTDRPTIVLARTVKGKGLPGIEGQEHWHGKALDKETAEKAVAELKKQLDGTEPAWQPNLPPRRRGAVRTGPDGHVTGRNPPYQVGGKEVATRKGFGDALAAIGKANPKIVVLDGDVKNSTFTEEFQELEPDRFFESYIAEQNMVGMAMGL